MSKRDEFVAPAGYDWKMAGLVGGLYFVMLVGIIVVAISYNMMNPACTPATCPNNYVQQTL